MKRKVIAIFAAAVILSFTTPELTAVEDKIFTSSGQILPGEEWNNVYIYNDDTIVDMLGGDVDEIGSYDTSTINVTGGYVMILSALELSTANVSGGIVAGLESWDYSTVNLLGTGSVFSLNARGEFGTINMTGGTTEYLRASDNSIINLYGGLVTEHLNAWDSSTVNIYGHSFNYNPAGGSWNGGQLTGFYLDDAPFTIDLYDMQTYNHVNLIPEPASLVLLACGALLLRSC